MADETGDREDAVDENKPVALEEKELDDRFDLDSLSAEDKAQLVASARKLSKTLSTIMNSRPFEATGHLSEIARRATLPMSPEMNQTIGKLVNQAVARPNLGRASERLRKISSEAVMPKVVDTKRLGSVLSTFDASAAGKAIFGSTGTSLRMAQLGTTSPLAELLGKSAAERAAFSVTSGLKVSDSVTAMVSKSLAGSSGLGLTVAGASVGKLGLTARASVLESLAKSIAGPENTLIRSAFGPSESVRRITQQILNSDIGAARSLAMKELVATSGLADIIGRDTMVASWRQSMLAEATARSLVGTMTLPDSSATLLRDIVGTNTATARVVGRYAELNKALMLAPSASGRPTRELRSYLTAMPVSPEADDLRFAVRASRGVAGLVAADLLESPGVIEREAGELLEKEVVEPWVSGPQRSRDVLFARLGALDAAIPELLQAAWDQVERKGPAAVSMASHAVVESLDRTLRAVAPNDAVLEADAGGRLPENSTYDRDGQLAPTRTGRIAYALLERRSGQTKLVAAQAKSLSNTVKVVHQELQSGKHASEGTVGLIRTYLVSIEHVLMQLLFEPGDD